MNDDVAFNDDVGTPVTASAVNALKTRSGLSWQELARVLGVGQRTVFAWTQGARMNQSHIELLKKLTTIVDEIATASPEATRIVLFTPGADGFSPYQTMLRELEIPGRAREGFTVEQLLGGAD